MSATEKIYSPEQAIGRCEHLRTSDRQFSERVEHGRLFLAKLAIEYDANIEDETKERWLVLSSQDNVFDSATQLAKDEISKAAYRRRNTEHYVKYSEEIWDDALAEDAAR